MRTRIFIGVAALALVLAGCGKNDETNASTTRTTKAPTGIAAKPAVQKNYTLLSDVQIAGIKERLKLSPDQESYWPGVEKALRAITPGATQDAQGGTR